MIRFFITLAFLVNSFSISNVCAESKSKNVRIINGTPTSPNSISVVRISVTEDGESFLCTGTMIAPDVVLTARHCVTSTPSNHIVTLRGRRYGVSRVRIHPLARETQSGLIYDVALLYLRRNPNASYFPIITKRSARSGDTIYIYGYGLDDNGNTGRLLTGSMTIESTNTRWIISEFNGNGSNTCSGDSGGPAFSIFTDSNGNSGLGLVGVTSGGIREDCQAGDVSYFTNLQSSVTRRFLTSSVTKLRQR
jgi:V8-like Glu-specific endopeptidase